MPSNDANQFHIPPPPAHYPLPTPSPSQADGQDNPPAEPTPQPTADNLDGQSQPSADPLATVGAMAQTQSQPNPAQMVQSGGTVIDDQNSQPASSVEGADNTQMISASTAEPPMPIVEQPISPPPVEQPMPTSPSLPTGEQASPPASQPLPPAEVAQDQTVLTGGPAQPVSSPPHYQPPNETQPVSPSEPTGAHLAPDQSVAPLAQHQPSDHSSAGDASAIAPPSFAPPALPADNSALPFTPIPEPDSPDSIIPASADAIEGTQNQTTIAKYHPQSATTDTVTPRVADKFEHSQHTYQPSAPVDDAPAPIGHTDPRSTTHPLDAGRSAEQASEQIESLSFDEIKTDPVPKSPVPSQLPPNPLLGSDHKSAEVPTQPAPHQPITDTQPASTKVEFHPPVHNFERLKVPFIVGAVSVVLLTILIIPLWFSMNGGDKNPTNNQAVTTLKNLPSGYVSVDRGCYSIPLPKDNTIPLSNNCALAGSFGGDNNNNISIIPQTKAYSSPDSYYQDATKAPNQLQEISKSTILLDGLPAIKVIHNIGSGNDVQKQLSVYVVTSIKGYKVGTTKIEGFEMTMSYNNPVSESVAEQVLSLWKWH